MLLNLKDGLNKTKVLSLLTIVCAVSGALCAVVGDVFIALAASTLAAIFLFDGEKKLFFTINCSLLVAANIAINVVLGEFITLFALEVIIISLVVAICFYFSRAKSICAAITTVIIAIFTLISFYLFGAAAVSNYSLDAVISFYEAYIIEIKEGLVAMVNEATLQAGEAITSSGVVLSEETVYALVDSVINSAISILVISSFAVCGILLKFFGALVIRLSSEPLKVAAWRFIVGSAFAYAYFAIAILSFFVDPAVGTVGLAAHSFVNIFMCVFAYLGILAFLSMLGRRFKPVICWIILIVALLLLSSLAIEVLSYFGAFATINVNKRRSQGEN